MFWGTLLRCLAWDLIDGLVTFKILAYEGFALGGDFEFCISGI